MGIDWSKYDEWKKNKTTSSVNDTTSKGIDWNKYDMRKSAGLDTLSSDLETYYNNLNGIDGWKDANYMNDLYNTTDSLNKRIKAASDYYTKYGADENTLNSYKELSSNFDDILKTVSSNRSAYSNFSSEEDYNKAVDDYNKRQDWIKSYTSNADYEEMRTKGESAKNDLKIGQHGNYFGVVNNPVSFVRNEIPEERKNKGYGAFVNQYLSEDWEKRINQMDDDEVNYYNYLLGKEGMDSANKYLSSLVDDLSYRAASNMVNEKNNTIKELGTSYRAGLENAFTGLDSFVRNMIGGSDKYNDKTILQYADSMMRSDNEGAFKVASDIINGIGLMTPSLLTGGAIGQTMFGLSAAGNYYNEAIEMGMDRESALISGAIKGALEVGLERAIGGIASLGGKGIGGVLGKLTGGRFTASSTMLTANLLNKILPNATSTVAKVFKNVASRGIMTIVDMTGKMAGEFVEEGSQDVLAPFVNLLAIKLTGDDLDYDWEADIPTLEEFCYTGLIGALTAGVLELPTTYVHNIRLYNLGNNIGTKNITSLADIGIEYDGRMVSALSQVVKNNPEYQNPLNIGKLYANAIDNYSAQMNKSVESLLEERGIDGREARMVSKWIKENLNETGSFTDEQISKMNQIDPGLVNEFNKKIVDKDKAYWNAIRKIEGVSETSLDDAKKNVEENFEFKTKLDSISKNYSALNTLKAMHDEGLKTSVKNDYYNAKSDFELKNTDVSGNVNSDISVDALHVDKDGNNHTISDFNVTLDKKNKILQLTTEEGNKVNVKDVVFKNQDTSVLYNAAAQIMSNTKTLSDETINSIINNYEKSGYSNPVVYMAEMVSAYAKGRMDVNTKTELSNDEVNPQAYVLREAYRMGKESAMLQGNAKKKGKGNVDTSKINVEKLSDDQKWQVETFNRYAKMFGVDISLYDSKADSRTENGAYNPLTQVIEIDINAGLHYNALMLNTFGHELGHHLRNTNKKAFNQMVNYIIDEFGQEYFDTQVLEQRNQFGLDEETAMEEVVCNACANMLTDAKAYKILERISKENTSLKQIIVDFVKDFIKKIEEFYGIYKSDFEIARRIDEVKDFKTKLQNVFLKGLMEDVETEEMTEEQMQNLLDSKDILKHERFVKNHLVMLDKNFDYDNAAIEKDELTERYNKIIDIWKELGGELNSKFLNDWNNQTFKDRAFTIFKEQQGYKYNIELATMCKKGIPLFEAIDQIVRKEIMDKLNTKTIGKAEKEILYDILKKHNFEIPCSICYVEQARQREGEIINAFLEGKVDTNKKGQVTKFKLGWNQVLDMVEKRMAEMGVKHSFEFVDRSIATDNYSPETINMDKETQDAFYEALLQLCNEEIVRYNRDDNPKTKKSKIKSSNPADVNSVLKGSLGSNFKIFKVLFNNPDSRFRIKNDLLYSSETTKNLSLAHNDLYSLFNMQGGVSGYKTKQRYVVYLGDILNKKWESSKTRDEGGIRNQSNSDLMMYTLLDQVQMYVDLSARGYYFHAYTKVLAELKLFGLSNAKINASLIPMVHAYKSDGVIDYEKTRKYAGLDENGNPIYDDIEGIPHEEAFMLLSDSEYSKSISGICIGYSDAHIMKLLDEPKVQLIIGFHDKTDNPDKRFKGAKYSKNYNGLNEATRVKADGTHETVHIGFDKFVIKAENMFKTDKEGNFYGETNYNGKHYLADDIPMLAADLYKEYCAKKNYIPAYHILAEDWNGNKMYMSDHPNYYKLLANFGLKNSEGKYVPHKKVTFNMPDQVPYLDENGVKKYMSTKDYIKQELEKELIVRDSIAQALADKSPKGIIPQFIEQVNNLNSNNNDKETENSDYDMKYSFRGENAILDASEIDTLNVAKRMEKDGASEKEIYAKTGWFKRSDGKWRNEIEDEIMHKGNFDANGLQSVKKGLYEDSIKEAEKSYKNGEISEKVFNRLVEFSKTFLEDYKNGKLDTFLHAPKLYKNYPKLLKVTLSFEDINGDAIGYSDVSRNMIVIDKNKSKEAKVSIESVLAHEIQHFIQSYEGFSEGASIEGAGSLDAYLNAPGEVEAREVEKRLNMTSAERANTIPKMYSDRILMGTEFSGGGMLEAGLLYKMIEKEFAVEWDEKIATVYSDNWGDHIYAGKDNGDVLKFDISKHKKNLFYFHASPVCHNFSLAKQKRVESPSDIASARKVAHDLEVARPQVFTVENAPAYLNSKSLQIIVDKLVELGYEYDVDVYNAADYGSATSRERCILRAVKTGTLPSKPNKVEHDNSWDKVTSKYWDSLKNAKARDGKAIADFMISAIRNTKKLQKYLNADGTISVDKPLLIISTTTAHEVTFAEYGELCPTLTTKCGEGKLILPGEHISFKKPNNNIKQVSPEFMGAIQGLEGYKYGKADTRAFTIIGNGIPTHLTKAVVGGLLESAYQQTHDGEKLYSERIGDRNVDYLTDVMTMAQHRQFMSEIDTKPKSKYKKSSDGDYIIPIDNLLVYTDFNQKDVGISKIIVFNTDDYTEIAGLTDHIYEYEKGEMSYEQTRRIINGFYKEEIVREYTNIMFGYSERYDRATKRGKSRSDSYHAEQKQKRKTFHFDDEGNEITSKKSNRASMTIARIDSLIEDSGAGSRKDYAQKWITSINPSDFLKMTLGLKGQNREYFDNYPGDYGSTVNNYDFIEGGLKKSRQTPYLAINVNTGEVVGHEGRHRMRALEKQGIPSAEIVIEFRDDENRIVKEKNGYKNPLEIIDSLKVYNQSGTGQSATLTNIIPLNNAFRNEVIQNYGDEDAEIVFSRRTPTEKRVSIVDALLPSAKNSREKNLLLKYKNGAEHIAEWQDLLKGINAEIKELSFAEGKRDMTRLKALQDKKSYYMDLINKYDKQLLNLESTETLKDLMKRESDLITRTLKAENKKAMSEQKAKYNLMYSMLKQEAKDKVSATRENFNRQEYLKRVEDDIKSMVNMALHPKGNDEINRIPDFIKQEVLGFVKSIDTSSKRLLKGGDATLKDNAWFNQAIKLGNVLANTRNEFYEPSLYVSYDFTRDIEALKKLIDEQTIVKDSDGKEITQPFTLNKMTSDQLHMLSRAIRQMKKAITDFNKLYQSERYKSVNAANVKFKSDMSKYSDYKQQGRTAEALKDFVFDKNMRPIFFFERLGEVGKEWFNQLVKGDDTLMKHTKQVKEFVESLDCAKEVNEWKNDLVEVKLSNEETFKATPLHLMGLYELSKRKEGLEALKKSGFRIGNFTRKVNKLGTKAEEVIVSDVKKFTDTDIDIIRESLTERQIYIADKLQNYMATQGAEWGNEVTRIRFQEEMFKSLDYYPISRDGRLFDISFDKPSENASLYALMNASFTKELSENANQDVMIWNILDVFSNHISGMMQYNAYTLPILNIMKWLNARPDDNGNSVRSELVRVFGSKSSANPINNGSGYAIEMLTNIIKAYNGTEALGDTSDGAILGLFHKHTLTQIAWNISSWLQQPLAITRATLVIKPKYLFGGALSVGQYNQTVKEMEEHNGIAIRKRMGFYDVNVTNDITRIVNPSGDTLMSKISEAGLKGAEFFDNVTWANIWRACKLQVEAENPGLTGDEYWNKVNDLFNETIYKTQVVDSILTKTEWSRGKGVLKRYTSAFMSEPVATASVMNALIYKYNMELRTGKPKSEVFKKYKGEIASTIAIYCVSQILDAAVKSVISAYRDEDKDEEFWRDKFGGSFAQEVIDELVPFNKLPIFNTIYELFKTSLGKFTGWDINGFDQQKLIIQYQDSLNAALSTFGKMMRGENTNYTTWYGIYNLLKVVSSQTGLPIATASREVIDLWNHTVGVLFPDLKITKKESNKG